MNSRGMRLWLLTVFVAALAAVAPLSLNSQEPPRVKRGAIQQVGNTWEQRIECSAPAREGGRLVVRLDLGSVHAQPGATDRVECVMLLKVRTASETEARRYFESYELTLRPQDGGALYLTGRMRHEPPRFRGIESRLQITAPLRFNLDIETQGGEIRVERLAGTLKAVTAGGDIRTGDIGAPVQVETAGGSILLGNVGGPLEARTAGGSIRVGDVKGAAILATSGGEIVAGQISGALTAETAGGDIVLRGATGTIEARTAGGQIQIGETSSGVRAQTAGGSIRLLGARGKVEVKTAGGSINLLQVRSPVYAATAAGAILAQMDPQWKTFSACDLQTAVGDVKVYLPPELALTVDALINQAAGHQIISDFPIQIQADRGGFIQQTVRGHGPLNGGGEVLKIRTIAGNIEIRKLDEATLKRLKERQDFFWKRWKEKEEERRRPPLPEPAPVPRD